MSNPEISAIIQALERYSGSYERESLDAAMALREELAPHLIDCLEKVAADPTPYLEDQEYYLYVYAVMLLGHFRETTAHQAIVKVFGLPDGAAAELFGDITTENLPIILLNTCGGDFNLIKSLVLNYHADDYVRGAAATALVYGVATGQLPRQEALGFFSALFTGEEAQPDSAFWSLMADCILDLQPQELMPVIHEADAKGLLDHGLFLTDEEFSRASNLSVDKCLERIRLEMQRRSLDDLHGQMSWWDGFHDGEPTPFFDSAETATTKKGKAQKKKKKKMAKASRRKNRR
jgi:hypothetical protein